MHDGSGTRNSIRFAFGFVPVIGTYIAGALPVLIALVHTPSTALWMLVFVVAYQQFENYLLIPRITARTLVTCPSEDKVIPVAHGARYAELIPQARFSQVEDCGHAMYFERPEEFAQVVTEFLADVEAGTQLSGASR